MVMDAQPMAPKALILSDGRRGHENQSIALCQHLSLDYDISEIRLKYVRGFTKALTYLLDHLHVYSQKPFSLTPQPDSNYVCVVSTGSSTYYANKTTARHLNCKAVAILNPSGFRPDFDCIVAPKYDQLPETENVLPVSINLSSPDPGFYEAATESFRTEHPQLERPAVGFIIGADNTVSRLVPSQLKTQLEQLFALTPDHQHWVTTSPRTPPEIEAVLGSFNFDYKLIFSQKQYNPIPAFITLCNRLAVTSDSASMVSEAVSFGNANVEVLLSEQTKPDNKFLHLIHNLENQNAVHVFDGALGTASHKIDLTTELEPARQHLFDF